jgi:hypothetical protein
VGKTGLILVALLAATPATAQTLNTTPATAQTLNTAPATAQTLAAGAMLTAAEPEQIVEAVRLYGRPAELETDAAGEPSIATGFGGIRGRIWFYDCAPKGTDCVGLQFQIGIGTERKLTLAQVNDFNRGRRFATLSLDEEGDPILTHDLSMARPGISAAAFRDTLQLFDTQAGELRKMVEALERGAREPR